MNLPDTSRATQGINFNEPLLFERKPGHCSGASLPAPEVPEVEPSSEIPKEYLRGQVEGMPCLYEPEVVRHYLRLSQLNYGVDTGFYPLGSCTMKYNPKSAEAAARLPGFANLHPLLPDERVQGALELMWRLERMLSEISGFAAVTLQPAAGAQGELAGLMMVRAYHLAKGKPRHKVLVPDSAHGTNPASSALNGFEVVELKSGPEGLLEPQVVAAAMTEDVAAVMMTNPNTLGVFEKNVAEIAKVVHAKGGLLYGDGANMNALLGRSRPGDMGVDVMQFNLHKTFATPHGGGGPGSGPVGVAKELVPFLPVPVVVKDGDKFRLEFDRPQTIGQLRTFWGNFGIMVRAYAWVREMGPAGLKSTSDLAVLNANYVRALLKDDFHLPYATPSLHEVVLNDKNQKDLGVTTMDIAKRLIDHGYHPPTIYFPLIVAGAMMIEPTETESRESIEAFVAAMKAIAVEAKESPEALKAAPTRAFRERLDEVKAARKPILRWKPGTKIEP
ncbi:MAG: aminomethyl-transferring glycine dehydrogenase subunit GcvPB [Deltaproteobacteria bacterium]|nr:aminomethyl-transferring glycine dehydrogenase subunit GcvPB [Deltaproteobacteria bacterium]